jgi:hypothetical protein
MSSTVVDLSRNYQEEFFTNMTDVMLNEFLHRITGGELNTHIAANMRNHNYGHVTVQTKIKSKINNNKLDISAYIDLKYRGKRRLHVTLHLTSDDFNAESLGPLHAKNNTRKAATSFAYRTTQTLRKRRYIARANRNAQGHTRIATLEKQEIIDIIMEVMSNYIDQFHPYYLETKLTPLSNRIHPNLMPIINARKHTSAPIKQTELTQ